MSFPPLYAVLDVEAAARAGWRPRDLGRAFLAGGARFIQLRAKHMTGGATLELAQQLADDMRAVHGTLIVNDRADVAALAGAHGVHVGQDDLRPSDVRRLLPPSALVGLSTHTRAQLEAARREPVDYVAIGPVFGTATKETGYEPVGLEMVRAAAAFGRPVVAIGGIRLETARSVIDAGAASVAVISDLLTDGNPERRVRSYVRTLCV